MATPHFNYYPPSGSVIDQNEPTAYWNGKRWQKKKKNYAVPSGHRLVGRPGGPLNGWYYDWAQRAWMEPDKPTPAPARPPAMPAPMAPTRTIPAGPIRPVSMPLSTRDKENTMSKCGHSRKASLAEQVMEVVKVGSYIAGPILIAAGQTVKSPAQPPVTPAMPVWLIEKNKSIYEDNKSAYLSRKGDLQNWGQALLTFGSSGLSATDKEEIGKIVQKAVNQKAA